jgi:hypothetical protein
MDCRDKPGKDEIGVGCKDAKKIHKEAVRQ